MLPQFFPLTGGVRHYAWGERLGDTTGRSPYIPGWLGVAPGDEPWAEVWLGAHPSLPAQVQVPGKGQVPLDQLIAADPAYWCGARAELPFLLKLLACSHPLSIQSHPDRQTAVRLHAQRPDAYPDPNDKTEIIVALTRFQAMAGFRNPVVSWDDISSRRALAPWVAACGGDSTMQGRVTALFRLETETVARMCADCADELAKAQAVSRTSEGSEALFLRLQECCPGDRGTLFAFLLNHITLEPGEGCFLPPNSPHAYLDGVGIECMTNSDNVIRAGLTPKAVDVPTMLETLDFARSGVTMMVPPAGPERVFAPAGASFQVMMLRDAPLELARVPGKLLICAVMEGEARFTCAAGELRGGRGTAWIRPAALADGTIVPAAAGTYLACATVQQA